MWKLSRETVIELWVFCAIRDLHIAFYLEKYFRWYVLFFCHQGLEKLCKAYLLGIRSSEYESCPEQQGKQIVNRIAINECGHDLKDMIKKLISYGVLDQNIFRQKYAKYGVQDINGNGIIKILERAYLECRYPVPHPIYQNYPIKKRKKGQMKIFDDPLGSSEPRKFAFDIGLKIIERIEKDFNIPIPRENFYSHIDKEDWTRFRRIFFRDI